MKPRVIVLLPMTLLLCSCASSLTGVGGTSQYGCRAPVGTQCASVSGVYANSLHTTRPAASASSSLRSSVTTRTKNGAEFDPPLRSAPRLLRVWIAPWEDSDGDLHDDAIVHMLVDPGHWLIEHVRPPVDRPEVVTSVATPPVTNADAANPKSASATPAVSRLPIAPSSQAGSGSTMQDNAAER